MVREFLRNHSDFKDMALERGLYIRNETNEEYIFECQEWKNQRKVFIFVYQSGYLVECRTETNTFNGYYLTAPWSDQMQLVSF